MSQTRVTVDKEWFEKQDTEHLTAEELDKLAHEDRENSKVEGVCSWWGLG